MYTCLHGLCMEQVEMRDALIVSRRGTGSESANATPTGQG